MTRCLSVCMLACSLFFVHAADDAAMKKRAEDLAQKFMIVDGHVDIPYRIFEHGAMIDISKRTPDGDFDYVRAKAGGLSAPFMSIYVPADLQKGGAKAHADTLIDLVEDFEKRWPDKFAVAHSTSDVEAQFAKGLISLPLGMENGAPIEGDFANLEHFYKRGIRYITLAHSRANHICDSSYDPERKWKGLSPFGKKLIPEMNRLGIMVDISHVSDDTFWQVMNLTKAPAIASHSSCRHFTPGFERNMSDEMVKRLAENGGVIMINFGSTFISGEIRAKRDEARRQINTWLEENNLSRDDPRARSHIEKVRAESRRFADVTDVADHFDHVVELVGIEHVGFGSDYDGVGDSLPTGLKDPSYFPNLIFHLLQRGYSEADIEKICYGNVMRVWKEVERIAAQGK